MSQGHRNVGGAGMTQNQGNVIGDRPCVRQSKLFRQHDSGNAMKDLMGQGHTKWDVNQQQGAYQGKSVYDHNAPGNVAPTSNPPPPGQYQQEAPQQYQQEPQQYQQQDYQQQQYQQPPQQQEYQQAPPPQQYQQQQPMAPQQVNTAPAPQQGQPKRQNYHNQNAGFNFFTGESK